MDPSSTLRRAANAETLLRGAPSSSNANAARSGPAETPRGEPDFGGRSRLLEEIQAHAAADAAVANRDRLLAIFSHDLRNLLNVLSANAEVFLKTDGDRAVSSADNIRRSVARMDRMLSNLLDLARVNAGLLDMTLREFDMADLAREAVALFQPLAERRSIEMQLSSGEVSLRVLLDHDRVFQVLSNLLSNAIRYTAPHGTIRISLAKVDGAVRISIENSGPRIPEEDLERVFEAYRRRESGSREGLGLGLYISRAIVLGHGGRMWATSQPGGNTFTFTIPLAQETDRS